MTGYDRALFGPAWTDTDRNGCDTRNDILNRDLTSKTFKAGTGGCVVLTGTLHDPYSGTMISFIRGTTTSTSVQIDHVVALGNAWVTGAAQWPYAEKIAFANDPLNLLAVKGSLNEQKGDGDSATWLPPNKSFRCAYVARQVSVKAKYGLYVTPAEKTAIQRILVTCPRQPLLTGGNPTTSTVLPPIATATTPGQPEAHQQFDRHHDGRAGPPVLYLQGREGGRLRPVLPGQGPRVLLVPRRRRGRHRLRVTQRSGERSDQRAA